MSTGQSTSSRTASGASSTASTAASVLERLTGRATRTRSTPRSGAALLTLDVARLAEHQRLLLDRGATPSTVRDVLTRLSGILQTAVEHGHLNANAARALRKVPADAGDEVRPLAPVELERLLAALEGRDRAIVLLTGHLGLRPLEVRAAPWSAFDGTAFVVGRAHTKRTARRTRTISVPDATVRELKVWQLRSGRPGGNEPIIGAMTPNAMKLWGRRVLRPAAKAATDGREDVTLYTLRHTQASACHYAGFTIPEAARRLGHGPGLHVETYAHRRSQRAPLRRPRRPRRAHRRRPRRPGVAPRLRKRGGPGLDRVLERAKPRCLRGSLAKPSVGLEPTTPSLPWKCSTN
jgi:integrase